MRSNFVTTVLFQIIFSSAVVSAFNFTFSSDPTQCSPLTVTVNGGTPPYRLNLVPSGPMPGGGDDIRKIVDEQFSDKTFTLDALKFPASSEFFAMVSDATGVGTGGTSAMLTVSGSNNTSCLPTVKRKYDYFFFLNPDIFTLCQPVNITWTFSQGDVTLAGLIPGGQSFEIPVPSGALYYEWTPQIEPGTSVFILGGDSRGRTSGGSSTARTVANGARWCLNGGAFSTTQSPYAGQVATATPSPSSSSNDRGGINRPMLIGIVAGLLTLFALAGALFYFRRRKRHAYGNKVDLFKNDDRPRLEPPNALEPTPYLIPPTIRGPEQVLEHGSFEGGGYRYNASTIPFDVPRTSIGYAHSQQPSIYTSHGLLSPPLTGSTDSWGDSRTHHTRTTSLLNDRQPLFPTKFSKTNPGAGGLAPSGSGFIESRKPPLPRAQPAILQHQDAGTMAPTTHQEVELIELPPRYADVGMDIAASPPSPAATAPPQ